MGLHKANQTSYKKGQKAKNWNGFKKGMVPWNKGIKGVQAGEKAANWKGGLPNCEKCGRLLSQRHSKRKLCKNCFFSDPLFLKECTKRLLKIDNKGEKSWIWKGGQVSNRNLHRWVERWLGKPKKCTFCKKKKGRFEWASISHHARRDLTDYIRLCVACHRKYDKEGRIKS